MKKLILFVAITAFIGAGYTLTSASTSNAITISCDKDGHKCDKSCKQDCKKSHKECKKGKKCCTTKSGGAKSCSKSAKKSCGKKSTATAKTGCGANKTETSSQVQ